MTGHLGFRIQESTVILAHHGVTRNDKLNRVLDPKHPGFLISQKF